MTLTGIITNKISRLAVGVATIATAAILAFGGLSSVGAVSEYQCGTYGGGDYNQGDCTEPTQPGPTTDPTPPTNTTPPSSSTPPKSNDSGTTPPASTTSDDNTILLNDFSEYTSSEGKSLTFKTGAVFYFNLKGEKHSITVKSFDATKLVVTIASTPTDVSIASGETVTHDVDQDGTDDISLSYDSGATDNDTASATFRSLATTPTTTTGTTSNSSTGGTTATTEKSANLWWVWIIPIVIGVALLIWALLASKRRKAAASANGGGTNFNQF